MAKYMLGTWHSYYLNTTLLFTIGTYASQIVSTCIYFRTSHTTYRPNGMVDYVVDYTNLPRCLIIGCSVAGYDVALVIRTT